MNIRLLSLSAGIALSGFVAVAFPVFAETPYKGNYGAGYVPSPVVAGQDSSYYQPINSPVPYPTAYGAGFSVAPVLTPGNGSNLIISTSNYGAGFLGSPALVGNQPNTVISTGNYGAGFLGSPALQGGNTTPVISTGNYGAGFLGSPLVVQSYPRVPAYGHYGAGFILSPAPWFGGSWFRW